MFNILWTELSKKPNLGPDTKLTVHLDLLHELAVEVFLQKKFPGKGFDIDGLEYPAKAKTPTTPNASEHSSSSSSKSSHSADPSYGV